MKKALAVLLTLAMISSSLLFGCAPASSDKASGDAQPAGSGSPTIDRILESGKIRIGIALNGPPIGFRDDAGTPSGYDVDFATKLAESLGGEDQKLEIEWVDVDGETRIPALTSGRVDIVFANITGRLDRAKLIDFSIPYLMAGIKMLTPAGSPYKTVEDLNKTGVKVVVARGTTGEELALKYAPSAEIIYVPNFTDQLLQLEQGKADAAFEDSGLIDYAAMQSNGKLEAQEKRYTSDPICIGLPKGDLEFVRWVDMFVSWQITQGFQAETYEKWWGVKPDEMKALW